MATARAGSWTRLDTPGTSPRTSRTSRRMRWPGARRSWRRRDRAGRGGAPRARRARPHRARPRGMARVHVTSCSPQRARTQADVEAKTYDNTATATATPPEDDGPAIVHESNTVSAETEAFV